MSCDFYQRLFDTLELQHKKSKGDAHAAEMERLLDALSVAAEQ